MKLSKRTIDSQPSWQIGNANVEIAVTELGAHMAPVTFCRDQRKAVQPYYVSPWQNENVHGIPPVMVPLRGDFFCMPFGGNGTPYQGEKHPPHGETCGSKWTLKNSTMDDGAISLTIQLKTKVRAGLVRRTFTLREGHNAVYGRTVVEGFTGRTSFAHHANLRMPENEKALLVSTSPFSFGRTYPVMLANPEAGEYQWLAKDRPFSSLSRIPSIFKDEPAGDCSVFPTRPGFCDLIQQFERPRIEQEPSWVAAVNTDENWLWFAFKNPSLMPGRLFWIENHGRHSYPWNGRNSCLGLEDGCMYFDRGIAESCGTNPINKKGIPTSVSLKGKNPFDIPYIQGAVSVPRGFGRVKNIRFIRDGVIFSSESRNLEIPLDHEFLFRKYLA